MVEIILEINHVQIKDHQAAIVPPGRIVRRDYPLPGRDIRLGRIYPHPGTEIPKIGDDNPDESEETYSHLIRAWRRDKDFLLRGKEKLIQAHVEERKEIKEKLEALVPMMNGKKVKEIIPKL